MQHHRILIGLLVVSLVACRSPRAPTPTDPPKVSVQRGPAPSGKADQALPLPRDEGDPREPIIAKAIAQLLETAHLTGKKLDDELSAKAFDRYLKATDPGKQFLLQSHATALRAHRLQLDDQLKSGKLTLVHATAALMRARVAVVAKLVAARLAKPFDFSRVESVESDSDKRTWAKDEGALAERWRKALKLMALARSRHMAETLAAAAKAKKANKTKKTNNTPSSQPASLRRLVERIPKTEHGRDDKARVELAKRYAGRFARLASVQPIEHATTFINAIARQYDPHTGYLPPASKENFDIQMSGSLEGIGAVLMEDDHYIRVVRIVPGGASWRQGELENGDLIMAVAQAGKESVGVGDARLDRVVRLIRGKKGTVVILTVKKPDDRVKLISITRDVIKIEAAYARAAIVEPKAGQRFGYIQLPSFYGNTRTRRGMTPKRHAGEDVRRLLELFGKRKIKSVVIDLRGNGGGLLEDAREITGLFIKSGPIVQVRGRDKDVQVLRDTDERVVFGGPVVVLVDRHSASASEIVAGALQDYGRAVIVGTGATHGKGTVQVLLGLDRLLGRAGSSLGVLKLTRDQFFRVSGDSTQLRGVVPDVQLVDPGGFIKGGERRLDNALPWSQIKAVPFQRWSKSSWDLATLRQSSRARQAKSKVFKRFEARNKLLTARRSQTVIPLERGRWKAWLDRREKELTTVTPDLGKVPKQLRVAPLVYAKSTMPVRPRPGQKTAVKGELAPWKSSLARDPWLAEAVEVLREIAAAGK